APRPTPGGLSAGPAAAGAKAQGGTPPPAGVHRGIALNEVNGTFTAAVIEASVGDALRIHRVVSAIDCGTVVNPLTVEMQVESATVYALTAALYGEITIKDGRVQQSNFHNYRILRLDQIPMVGTGVRGAGGSAGRGGRPPVAGV